MSERKPIGLIGGMGPYASDYFYRLLLDKAGRDFGAKNNDDFPEIILDSVPVPDFISDTKRLEEAKKILIDRVKRLESVGCGEIGMVCNTGHLLSKDLVKTSRGKFVSMIDLVAKEARKRGYRKVGVLTTPTMRKSSQYKKALRKHQIEGIDINGGVEKAHEEIIREVIAGQMKKEHGRNLCQMARKFIKENKLDGIVLGCTELPLVFPKDQVGNVIDCMDVLADELLVRYYQGK